MIDIAAIHRLPPFELEQILRLLLRGQRKQPFAQPVLRLVIRQVLAQVLHQVDIQPVQVFLLCL